MNQRLTLALAAALCLALPVAAQKLNGGAAATARAETRIMAYTEDYSVFALASVTYGQPEWKAEYDGMLDQLKGKNSRLGKDWFTTLITSSELDLGGAKVAPGSYIVGIHCSPEGKFSLALMDSTKAMKNGVNPFHDWKPEIVAPLTLHKGTAKEPAKLLTMAFDAKAEDGGKGTFTVAWGTHKLTAPCQLHAPKQ